MIVVIEAEFESWQMLIRILWEWESYDESLNGPDESLWW